jgi:hypothetical protein
LLHWFGKSERPGADDFGSGRLREVRKDLGYRVRASHDDGVFVHFLDHFRSYAVGDGNAYEYVGALHRVGESALDVILVGDFGHFLFVRVHAVRTAVVDGALGIAEDGVLDAGFEEKLRDRDARSAGAVDDDGDVGELLADDFKSVDKAGKGDDRGAVLVVMEYRNIGDLLEVLFDYEALRGLDVLKVDAAPGGLHHFDHFDYLHRILGVKADRESIHAAEFLEQNAFAFHDRQAGACADIAEAQNSGSVSNNGDPVALGSIIVYSVEILVDFEARSGDAGSIGKGQIVCIPDRYFAFDSNFALFLFMQFQCSFVDSH